MKSNRVFCHKIKFSNLSNVTAYNFDILTSDHWPMQTIEKEKVKLMQPARLCDLLVPLVLILPTSMRKSNLFDYILETFVFYQ